MLYSGSYTHTKHNFCNVGVGPLVFPNINTQNNTNNILKKDMKEK